MISLLRLSFVSGCVGAVVLWGVSVAVHGAEPPPPEQLEFWITNGCLADVTAVHAKSLVDAWLERRAKLETPSNIQVVDDLM